MDSIIKIQEDLGLDPILITFSELEDEVIGWPSRFCRWMPEALENWRVETEIVERSDDSVTVRRTVTTPEGQLTSAYRRERYQKWTLEHLVKEESDLELLKYRPDPRYLDISPLATAVRKVGDRALVLHNFPGIWSKCLLCALPSKRWIASAAATASACRPTLASRRRWARLTS